MPLSLHLKQTKGKPGQVYYPLELRTHPKPTPGPGELLVRLHAAALNHRDFFQRQHLYPGISFEHPLLADGCGTVEAIGPDVPSSSSSSASLLGRRVLITPCRGWVADPDGPETSSPGFAAIGGVTLFPDGTAAEWAVVPHDEVELCPEHLTAAQGAALPLVGLTAWRALVVKTKAAAGGGGGEGEGPATRQNVLITGIGGGVALAALQFAVAMGCNAYVTSGTRGKIETAVRDLGARGGVLYRDADWDRQLLGLLPPERPYLDAVIDGAGGDIVARTVRLLKHGGIISCYGMTVSPRMDWSMGAVMKNIELRGATLGSRAEFRDMVAFVREKRIVPVVSRTVKGLDNIEGIESLYEDLRDGKQFGKLVIEIYKPEEGGSVGQAKL